MIVWPAKDPAEVLDFTWEVPLDEGDTLAADDFTATVMQGTVVIDSDDNEGGNVTLWLSGGLDGETAMFNLIAETQGGRTFREVAVLPVFDRASALLALFRLRYSAFAAVTDGLIGYWLADAARSVDTTWAEADQDPALLALAAHMLADNGALTDGQSLAGVTSFKSGSFSVTLSDPAASRTGLNSTIYGREFLALRARNFAGPMLAWDPPASVR